MSSAWRCTRMATVPSRTFRYRRKAELNHTFTDLAAFFSCVGVKFRILFSVSRVVTDAARRERGRPRPHFLESPASDRD